MCTEDTLTHATIYTVKILPEKFQTLLLRGINTKVTESTVLVMIFTQKLTFDYHFKYRNEPMRSLFKTQNPKIIIEKRRRKEDQSTAVPLTLAVTWEARERSARERKKRMTWRRRWSGAKPITLLSPLCVRFDCVCGESEAMESEEERRARFVRSVCFYTEVDAAAFWLVIAL